MPYHRLPAIAVRGALVLLILAGAAADALAQKVITQASALNGNVTPGDLPGFPVTISQSGTFVLGSDLVLPDANTSGIDIQRKNVTIDLGGFSIKGPGVAGHGLGIESFSLLGEVAATVIRNGAVSGMGSDGINLAGSGNRIDRITVVKSGVSGIVAGPASIVTNSRAAGNAGGGIVAGSGSLVESSVAASNKWGIVADEGCTLLSNTAVDNTLEGFYFESSSGWGRNVASNNNGGNGNPQFSGIAIALSGANLCGGVICP